MLACGYLRHLSCARTGYINIEFHCHSLEDLGWREPFNFPLSFGVSFDISGASIYRAIVPQAGMTGQGLNIAQAAADLRGSPARSSPTLG
jgi:hypothetical protein